MFKHLPLIVTSLLILISSTAFSQNENWNFVNEAATPKLNTDRFIAPQVYKTLTLNFAAYKDYLKAAPKEFSVARNGGMTISIPYPDNSFKRFRIVETKLMEDGLAAQLPGIKTYVGKGIDDPYATIRIDYTYQGFHAFVKSPAGNVYIDPYQRSNTGLYISYFTKDYVNDQKEGFNCLVKESLLQETVSLAAGNCIGTELKTYRLALACTGEYATAVCAPSAPTIPLTASAIVTSINRVVGIYETELAIRMVLIANNNSLIFLDPATDPYTNNNGVTMLGENQTTIASIIGAADYDIGHVFSTGGGGVAGLGVVCRNNQKAKGVTGSLNPVGDNYDVDYVAHEMGHQFGANHTFQSVTTNCGGNRNASTAYEPGSGTTIMAYAGICGSDNIQPHSDPYFHTVSFDEITTYVTTGQGSSCAVVTVTNNTSPTVIMPASNISIPNSTPFILTGSGFDVDGDALTYDWEEWDLATGGGSAWNSGATSTTSPLFKSRPPSVLGRRYFPALPVIIAGYPSTPAATMGGLKGETLPTVARNMKFRLTVRDNQPGGGGVATGGDGCSSAATFNVNVTADGPFLVNVPNTALVWIAGSTETVTWDVANTNSVTGINCQNVSILMSTDGGNNFNTVVLANTPNDGSQAITVPNVSSTTVRFMVKALGNIFFDISDVDFTITKTLPVSLLNFSVAETKDVLLLNWSTAQELNNKGFEILRSEGNTNNFVKIGFVNGAGTSNATKRYSYSDGNIRKGIEYFYKLRQVDIDNRFTFSDTRQGRINEDGRFNMVISPNPATDNINVYLNGLSKRNFTIVVADISGQVLSSRIYKNDISSGNVNINISNFAKGVYVLKILQDNNTVTKKIIKQ